MTSLTKLSNILHGLKPTLLMILVQIILAVVNVGYKLASNDGMSLPILVSYRFMFGAAFIIPVAIVAERNKRPKLAKKIVMYSFLCGLFGGSLGQNLYLKSLALTSATFISAMANLIPAITFIIAICLRLEKLGWNTMSGKAKVFGTVLGIGGAMVFTFVKGSNLPIPETGINLLEITSSHRQANAAQQVDGRNLVLGLILAMASVVCYSLWLIIQAKAAETYPCPYSITGMMTFFASTQSTLYALCIERDWSKWHLGLDIRLLTVLVAGVVGSGMMFTLVAWCVRMKGPLFVSIFNPLMLVMVAIAGNLFLEEKLTLGMVFGSILIVVGLYAVLWGKSKEMKALSKLTPSNENNQAEDSSRNSLPHKTNNHGSDAKDTEDEEEEEEWRSSYASSEVLSGLYIYP